MPNALSATGLTISSVVELVAALTADMQAIYGADINVDPNSPDGQLINIFAQACEDILELLLDTYNTFTVQSAYGVLLDQRVAMNGITRNQGTYTIAPVSITVSQALTLTGLDALIADPTAVPFTVSDNAGSQFSLQATTVIGAPGTSSLSFRAVAIGQVEVTPNTIQNQVTNVLGVTGVNNPLPATSTGVNEETDAQLKVRHAQSFALASTGPADAVEAAIAALPGVTDAFVVENATPATVNTVPANSIWPIVTGGTAAEIAQAIYAKKGLGCGQKGAQSHVITRPNGTAFVAQWDASIAQRLYIRFTINPRVLGTTFDTTLIATQLAKALVYKLGQQPTVGDVVNAMADIAPSSYQTALGVSKNGITYFDVVQPDTAQYYFTVAAGDILINQ